MSNPTKLSEEREHKGIYSQANVKNIVDEALNYQKQQLLREIEGMKSMAKYNKSEAPSLDEYARVQSYRAALDDVLALLTNKERDTNV